jgi:putative FmdB family regulatory protein
MPTYEYICQNCHHELEVFQSITERPIKRCPKCKGQLKRKIGIGGGLIFKGSGFYITDYKKGKSDGKSKPVSKTEKADSGQYTKKTKE